MRYLKWSVIALAIVIFVCFPLAYGAFLLYAKNVLNPRPPVHKVTTPLDPSVVQDVCQKLALPKDGPLCCAGVTVYAPDFSPAIKSAFTPGVTTYEQVQGKLGAYRYRCETPEYNRTDDVTTFRCFYDLKGDHVFSFAFSFTIDGVIRRVYADPGDHGL